MTSEVETVLETARIRKWVQDHHVTWEIGRLREGVKGHGTKTTGYELKLFAQVTDASPATWAAEANEVFSALRAVLDQVHSDDHDPLLHGEPRLFDHASHQRSERNFVPEVQITFVATPFHMDRHLGDEELRGRMKAIEEELTALGLCRRTWTEG